MRPRRSSFDGVGGRCLQLPPGSLLTLPPTLGFIHLDGQPDGRPALPRNHLAMATRPSPRFPGMGTEIVAQTKYGTRQHHQRDQREHGIGHPEQDQNPHAGQFCRLQSDDKENATGSHPLMAAGDRLPQLPSPCVPGANSPSLGSRFEPLNRSRRREEADRAASQPGPPRYLGGYTSKSMLSANSDRERNGHGQRPGTLIPKNRA